MALPPMLPDRALLLLEKTGSPELDETNEGDDEERDTEHRDLDRKPDQVVDEVEEELSSAAISITIKN